MFHVSHTAGRLEDWKVGSLEVWQVEGVKVSACQDVAGETAMEAMEAMVTRSASP
jgi:hypothetical protein